MQSKQNDSSLSSIVNLIDIVCISIMFFLPGKDFCSIQRTCKHFYYLLNPSFPMINNHWRLLSLQLCDNIQLKTYKSKQWQCIYQELLIILSEGRSFRVTMIPDKDKNQLPPLFQTCKYDCLHLFKLFTSFKQKDGKCDPNYQLCIEYSDNKYWAQRSYVTNGCNSYITPFYIACAAINNSARIIEYMLDGNGINKTNTNSNININININIKMEANYIIMDRNKSLLIKLVENRCTQVLKLLCTKSKRFVNMIEHSKNVQSVINEAMEKACKNDEDYDICV